MQTDYAFRTIEEEGGMGSPRGSRNSHINLKKRRICTTESYEDPTVYIILRIHFVLKNSYHTKKIHIGLEIYHASYTARIKK